MKKTTPRLLSIASILLASSALNAEQHKELGDVEWLRNYDTAIKQAQEIEKPVLLLFQEVPGCAGCVNYGETTLSHPLIVDAIEEAFVPLAIFNNKGGHDREILKRYNEPSWNFQVMRFVNSDGKDIIPRRDKVWTPVATAQRMVAALETADQPVPDYLRTVAWSGRNSNLKTAAFSMYCFWDGEAKLGGIQGVVETEAGWMDGREVVKLRYDPELVEWASLVKQAQSHGCAKQVYAPDRATLAKTPQPKAKLFLDKEYRMARASDQKRHLSFSPYKNLSLNPVQRTKINAALSKKDLSMISRWLAPSQRS